VPSNFGVAIGELNTLRSAHTLVVYVLFCILSVQTLLLF